MNDIAEILSEAWGLPCPALSPGPQGADRDSRLFHVSDASGAHWVLKWRRGATGEIALGELRRQLAPGPELRIARA